MLATINRGQSITPKVKVLGQDLNSEQTVSFDEQNTPSWQVLYTTFVHSCSPLRCGDTFRPIPLYHNPPTLNGDHKSLVNGKPSGKHVMNCKWQGLVGSTCRIERNCSSRQWFISPRLGSARPTRVHYKNSDLLLFISSWWWKLASRAESTLSSLWWRLETRTTAAWYLLFQMWWLSDCVEFVVGSFEVKQLGF